MKLKPEQHIVCDTEACEKSSVETDRKWLEEPPVNQIFRPDLWCLTGDSLTQTLLKEEEEVSFLINRLHLDMNREHLDV